MQLKGKNGQEKQTIAEKRECAKKERQFNEK